MWLLNQGQSSSFTFPFKSTYRKYSQYMQNKYQLSYTIIAKKSDCIKQMKCFVELIGLHDITNKEPIILQVRSYCIYSMNINILCV